MSGDEIRAFIKRNGTTQRGLALALQEPYATMRAWLTGRVQPPPYLKLALIALEYEPQMLPPRGTDLATFAGPNLRTIEWDE